MDEMKEIVIKLPFYLLYHKKIISKKETIQGPRS